MTELASLQEPPARDTAGRELRVTLAMNGGVSLAVWMGGVVGEVYRASRGEGLYGPLCRMLDTDICIDSLTGASAGGLNSVFLGAAITRDLPASRFNDLRDVWLTAGSFSTLLRDRREQDPPSLLQGDGVLLAATERVLQLWMAEPPVAPPPGRPDLELVLTTTTLQPIATGLTDSIGNAIVDPRHRAQFHFTGEMLRDRSTADLRARQMAKAARSTASFPGAFEPSYVHIGATTAATAKEVDMADVVGLDRPMWVVDGGVLMNKPIAPALGMIERHRFAKPGDRVLVYVNPDPGNPAAPDPAEREAMPGIASVVFASVVGVPRQESLAADLAEIGEYNRRFGLRRKLRESLLLGISDGSTDVTIDLVTTAGSIYSIWLRREGISHSDRVVAAHLARIGRTFDDPITPTVTDSRSWESAANALRLARGKANFLSGSFLAEGPLPTEFAYGTRAVADAWATVGDLVNRAFEILPIPPATSAGPAAATAEDLTKVRTKLQDSRRVLDQLQLIEAAYWQSVVAAAPAIGLGTWAKNAFDGFAEATKVPVGAGSKVSFTTALASVFDTIVAAAIAAAPACRSAADEADRWDAAGSSSAAGVLRRLVASVVAGDPDADDAAIDGKEIIGRRLVALFVVRDLADDEPTDRSRIQLVQVAADTRCPLDPGRTAEQKVRGLSVGHFGAFLKTSWRANDWMWGRFDGAVNVAEMLVTPGRLRRRFADAASCAHAIQQLLAATPGGEELYTESTVASALGTELGFLDSTSGSGVRRLPNTTRLIATALVRLAAVEELPTLADAIEQSGVEGANTDAAAVAFVRSVRKELASPAGLTPSATDALVRKCAVGSERVAEEQHSDAFGRTTLGVAGVGSSVLAGTSNKIGPVRRVAQVARRAFGWIDVIAESFLAGTRAGAGVLYMLLAVGGGIVGARLLGADVPTGALVVGWYLLAALVAVVAVFVGIGRAIGAVGFVVLLVVVATIDRSDAITLFHSADHPGWKPWLHWGGAAVLAVAFGIALFVVRKSPRWAKAVSLAGVLAVAGWVLVGLVARYAMQSDRWPDVFDGIHHWRSVVIAAAFPLAVLVGTLGSRLWRSPHKAEAIAPES
ncbi:MAG: patatin-like protein [Ilumatobacteraceae bacterium]